MKQEEGSRRLDSWVNSILSTLHKKRFSLVIEKKLQNELKSVFEMRGLKFRKEYRLPDTDNRDIPDFFFCDDPENPGKGIVVEAKLKANKMAIYKQCKRYAEHPDVIAIILITNTSLGFPETIQGKPCFVFKLAKAYL